MRKDADKNLLERGFTLVELLIVVVILGILAGIVVFAVGNLTDNAEKNACATEASTVETAVQAWKADEGNTGNPSIADLKDTANGGTLTADPKNLMASPPDATKFSYAAGVVTRGSSCS